MTVMETHLGTEGSASKADFLSGLSLYMLCCFKRVTVL